MLLTATLCLLAFGAVMVYSASSAPLLLRGQQAANPASYLVRYLIYGLLGLVLMQVLSRRGLRTASNLTPALLVVSFVLVLAVFVPGLGVRVNGARRWLGAASLQIQPSELLKLALVLYAARLLAAREQRARRRPKALTPLLLVIGIACLLVAAQPDLGTALVIALSMIALLVVAGVPLRTIGRIVGVAALLVAVYALLAPYRRARLTSFLDPWAHASGIGFQAVQGQIALGSGGLFGVGLGQSVQKVFFLPEAHTDFILAIIGEELGVVGIATLLALYGLIAYAGLRAARKATGPYTQLLAAGLTSLIVCEALLNVFTVLGLAPLTGVPLPFISYGSSNLLVMLAATGLLLNIANGGTVESAIREPTVRDSRRNPPLARRRAA